MYKIFIIMCLSLSFIYVYYSNVIYNQALFQQHHHQPTKTSKASKYISQNRQGSRKLTFVQNKTYINLFSTFNNLCNFFKSIVIIHFITFYIQVLQLTSKKQLKCITITTIIIMKNIPCIAVM